MATTPTNKPIPSEDPRDLKFNAGKIDEVVTSGAHYYTDRFGVRRWTIAGFQYTAEEAIRNYGYITMDSFEDGATLTLPNQVLRYEATGEYYRFDGELPKTVSAGSTPETSGGIGLGAWVSVGDASLRTELARSKGFTMIGGRDEVNDDIRAYVEDGDPLAPDYTQALKRAIASGRGRVYINVPVEIKEDLTIPRLFRVDVGENGYIYSTTNKVRVEGFINSIGGGDPYRNYIHQYGVDSSTVPGVYTYNVTVNVPEDYPTMQAAIDAVPDNYWQFITIQVSDGTYDEDLVIRNKRGVLQTSRLSPGNRLF